MTDTKARAQAARNLLDSYDFKVLTEEIRRDVFTQWIKTNVPDVDKREALHGVVNGLELMIAKATTWANEGKFEEERGDHIPQG